MTSLPDAAPIILVDNDSADGTADAVRTTHPEVRLIAAHDNLGAVARNVAVDLVTTPYVAFCDDDTRWQPGALTRGARILDRHPSIATVTGRCLVAPDLHDDPITPEMRDSPVDGPEWLPGPALLGIMAGLTMIRRSAFVAVGGFCPRFWLGGEEELLALDLAAAGWWMVWDGGMVIHHEPSLSRDAGRRRRLGIRNTLWTLWLRRPLPVAARRSAEIVASAPHDLSTLRAVTEALTGLPWVVRNRRVVPPAVERGLRSLEAPQRASTARRYVG